MAQLRCPIRKTPLNPSVETAVFSRGWATPENLALVVEGLNERSDDQSANIKAVVKLGQAVAAAMQAVAVPAAEGDVAIPGLASLLEGVPTAAFKSATHAIGEIKRFDEFCRKNSPITVAAGALPHEAAELQSGIAIVEEWLGRFAVALDDRSRQAIVTQPSDKSAVSQVEASAALAPTDDDLDIPDFLRRHAAENGGTEPNSMQAREGAAA